MRTLILFILLPLAMAAEAGPETPDDPYIWLEEVESEEALTWVKEQNKESLGYLEALATYEPMRTRNLEIYDSDAKILTPGLRGDFVYNFWQDASNRRGLWRRTTIDNYVGGDPEWDVVLDVDVLAEAEGEDWVWKGATCLRPDYRRCLLDLSRGGADATVVREFDVEDREFVADGFSVEEAKTYAVWVDIDTVFIGSDFGEGTLTDSGYARTSRIWRRGEPLDEATEIFAADKADVWAYVYRDWDGDVSYDFAAKAPSFFTARRYLYKGADDMRLIDIPGDAAFYGIMHGQMIVEIKSDWTIGETIYPQGALLSIDFERFMAGDRDLQVLLVPDESSAIKRGGVMRTRDYLIVNQLDDVVSRLTRFELDDGTWRASDIPTEGIGNITLVTAAEDSNVFFYRIEGFLRPDTLVVANDGGESSEIVQTLPEFFDASGMTVEQHFATSADGTRVPYFLVLPRGFEVNGKTPTLLFGYGGFQISKPPVYDAAIGDNWLERGGVYVIANIRGGGEYGPRWHKAAMLENRQRAYDDFIAVAEDLIDRNITSPRHLGIRGRSNGGLLTGVMLTQRPDLFNAAIVQVPLLDMRRFHYLLAGASWMAEYGNPDTDDWDFISKYSPYQNIDEDADYPVAFFITSTRDDRVHPGHARKMVARMLEMGHELYYFENLVGGHKGTSDSTQLAAVEALIHSYLWDRLGE